MTLEVLLGLAIRHILTAMGGGAFVQGLLSSDTINLFVGTIVSGVGVFLSVKEKKNR